MKTPRRAFLLQAGVGVAAARIAAVEPGRPRLKIGQIGVGHAHASKTAVYRNSPDYEVVGIVEPDSKLRERAQEHLAWRDLPWMTQEQLLNVPDLKAVLVETRVRELLNVAEACIAAGKHIHLDKPAGTSLPQFSRILAAAEQRHLLVQMGYMYRYNPGIVLLREFLKQGWLGDVFEVHAVMSKVVEPGSRKELAEFRGGVMFDLGGHLVDLVLGVLGKPAAVHTVIQHVSTLPDNLADNILAVLTWPRASATVKSSAMEVDGFDRRHLVVCGTGGTFHIQPLDNPIARITLAQPKGRYKKGFQEVTFPKYTRYIDDAAEMARIIRGETISQFSYEHDLHVQKTLLQVCDMPCEA